MTLPIFTLRAFSRGTLLEKNRVYDGDFAGFVIPALILRKGIT
jgi:hypothetical protein